MKTNWWIDYPWRMIQTNLREIDMLDIDADQYVRDLKEFKATVVLINTSGIIASYKTDLPFHFQSPFLQGDSLQKIIKACHEADIKVIARTDFSKVRRPIYEEHPEWAYKSPDGEIVDYNGDVHVCLNSDYQQKYVFQIIEETLNKLDVNGIFFNMSGYKVTDYSGNYHGICHCDSCKRRFDEMYDWPLPSKEDMGNPLYRQYLLFKKQTINELQERIFQFVKNINPDICIANNFDQKAVVRQESNTAIERPLPHWQYSASDNTKWVVSSYPGMISSNTTVDFIDFPYRHVAVSPAQQKLRLAQNLANGGKLDYYLIGRLDNHEDKSGFAPIKEMFHYHAEHVDDYRDLTSQATIGLLNGGREGNQSEYRGWFRFLVENHYLFDSIKVESALGLDWDKYQAIIIPDIESLSEQLCQKIDQFTASGGDIIIVGESGFRKGDFEKRIEPPFKCFGVEEVKTVRKDMRSAYFKINEEQQHLADTSLIYLDGKYLYCKFKPEVEQYLNLIPPHNFGPPERCYYEQITENPGFTVNNYGEGRAIYLPWKPGSLFYRQGHTNTIDFIADLLESFVTVKPIGGDLSPMVEVTLFANQNNKNLLVHLVNGSGHFGTTFYSPVTMQDIEVVIDLSAEIDSVYGLVSGKELNFNQLDDKVTIYLPELKLFEAIKIKTKN